MKSECKTKHTIFFSKSLCNCDAIQCKVTKTPPLLKKEKHLNNQHWMYDLPVELECVHTLQQCFSTPVDKHYVTMMMMVVVTDLINSYLKNVICCTRCKSFIQISSYYHFNFYFHNISLSTYKGILYFLY